MKKTTFILLGIAAIVLLFIVWVYLLIYGTPAKVDEFFTDFSLFGSSENIDVTPTTDTPPETAPVVDVIKDKLRQLTTRPVIGFHEFKIEEPEVRFMSYAEAGTGHIYQINLETGEETRLSNTTVPNAELAVFSPNGAYVVIRSGFGSGSDVILLELVPEGSGTIVPLTPPIVEFTFSDENELLYTETTRIGTEGKAMNLQTKISRALFTVPFQAVTMIWSTSSTTPHYAYPKAAARLYGYLYAIKNGTIVRLPASGGGLVAEVNSKYAAYTKLEGTEPASYLYDSTTQKTSPSPILIEPSKCVFSPLDLNTLYCGHELTTYSYDFPDDWYRGTRSFSDRIWQVDLGVKSATQIVSPPQVAGRDIDLINMNIASDAKMLYFMNKNDNTLWLYEI